MPRLYNPQRRSEPVVLADGSSIHIRAKARIYVSPEKMTGVIWGLVKAGRLVNRGGDPVPILPKPVLPKPIPPTPKLEAKTDTSSNHHQSRASVSSGSPETASVKKEEKADKKQQDSDQKVVTKSNDKIETKSESVDSKPKRGRRKRKING
jgi:hypothetical protein